MPRKLQAFKKRSRSVLIAYHCRFHAYSFHQVQFFEHSKMIIFMIPTKSCKQKIYINFVVCCCFFFIEANGRWGHWGYWSFCTKSMDGIQTRTRTCECDQPVSGCLPCHGTRVSVRQCGNTQSCPKGKPSNTHVENASSNKQI